MRGFLYHFWPYSLSIMTGIGVYIGGIFNASGLVIIFALHPILDHLLTKRYGDSKNNIDKVTNVSLYIWPLFQTVFLCLCFSFLAREQNLIYFILGSISVGIITGGFGITIAHELIHRPVKWQRGLGVWILITVNYAVFRIEHVFGHHRNVATPGDPATAKKGENLYFFIPKATYGVFLNAKKIEDKRCSRENNKIKKFLKNRFNLYSLVQLAVSIAVLVLFGPKGLLYFFIQSLVAICLLEMVDFIEHYGLERKKLPNGRYEPVGPEHSWDTNFFMTNTSLYNLGKHAHHHQIASLSFQHLNNTQGAHNYPFGYSTAIILALFPPLWRKVVDPLI